MELDDVIIGSGQAAAPLARALGAHGRRVAVVEREHVGGSCVNDACTPTKAVIASARRAYLAHRAKDLGVRCADVSVDMAAVRQRKREIVERFREGVERRLDDAPGVLLITGEASFVDPHRIEVRDGGTSVEIQAARFHIDVGQRPRRPPIPGLEEVRTSTPEALLELDRVPPHLVVIGGGSVGLELGQAYRRLGSRITIVEESDRLLPDEEPEIVEALRDLLDREGIDLRTGTTVEQVRRSVGNDIEVSLRGASNDRLIASHLLLAAGMVPNTDGLGLYRAQVVTDERGYIPTDAHCRTSAPHIYALGDVRGGPAFTHVAYDDHRVVLDAELGDGAHTVVDRPRTYVIFTDPELGRLGETEAQARSRVGAGVRASTLPMKHVARALERGEPDGLMKAVVDREGRILGCSVLAVEGGELVSLVQLAMQGGLRAADLADAVLAHPTLAESLNGLFAPLR